jgi:hypothetical protein
VLGPVDMPPWLKQRPDGRSPWASHGVPSAVLAPQRGRPSFGPGY